MMIEVSDNILGLQERALTITSLATVETHIKESTFLGNSLLKDHIFCLYNPYIRDGEE